MDNIVEEMNQSIIMKSSTAHTLMFCVFDPAVCYDIFAVNHGKSVCFVLHVA